MTHTLPESVPTEILINGQLIPAASGTTFTVEDPATGKTIVEVANSTAPEWDAALECAVSAQAEWAGFSPRARADILMEIFHTVRSRADDFARTMTLEMGKPLAEAHGEVTYGTEYLRWFAEEAVRVPGRFSTAPAGNGSILVTRTPVGPVLAITPWNFPLAMTTRKIAPALAAGCPVLVKPAAETPLTMLLFGQVVRDVLFKHGAPMGLISILPTTHSAGLSTHLMADPRLRKVTFTGSTPVGKILVRQSADQLLRTSMELGGNAPFVVAADSDLDLVLGCAMQAKMRNGGEACIAANRFLVDASIAEEFTQRLTDSMSAVRMGHGLDEGTTLGPIITAKQRDRIATLVSDAVDKGARVTTGGTVPEGAGYFYPATVLADVPSDAAIVKEEIFGPVATVTAFDTVDEGIEMANATEFGLAAYGFTSDYNTAQLLAERLQAGMVGINRSAISDPAAPFGGIKQSGFGREGGSEGIEEYLDVKYVAM